MFTHKNTYERGNVGEVEAQFLVEIYEGMGCEEVHEICLSQTDVYMQKFYLMENGKIIQKNLRLSRITPDELTEHLREKDVIDLSTVQYAILEFVSGGQRTYLNMSRIFQKPLLLKA